jgi:hypothetical protein
MSRCPSLQTLHRLGAGSFDGPTFAAIEAHVEECDACQSALERLAGDPSDDGGEDLERSRAEEATPMIPGFVIECELGRGGMGIVYRAWQPQLARHVAIKFVRGGIGGAAEDRRRWLREARAIGRIRDRNIVQVHQAGEQDGWLYLVLDLVPGGNLARRVAGPLPPRVAAGLAMTVARAVEQIHRAGILHLDIKPSNILLDGPADGTWARLTPMITDFGIARSGDDPGTTTSGAVGARGTPSYMAPEQIAGKRDAVGPRTDVYALGATLYHLLTGRPPFQAASVIETLDLVRTSEPAAPRSLVPGLPPDLETITLACLEKDPRRRYASAEALADDLERWRGGFPIRARAISRLERCARWCRRRPALAAAIVVVLLTVSASLASLLALWRRSETQRARAEGALDRAVQSERIATGAVGDLIGLVTALLDAPEMSAAGRLDRSIAAVQELTARLRRDRGFSESSLIPICQLERQLAVELDRGGKLLEARELLNDSLALIEARRTGRSADAGLEAEYGLALHALVSLCCRESRGTEAVAWFRRAQSVLERMPASPQRMELIGLMDGARSEIAELQERNGEGEVRRLLLASHVRMLERMATSGDLDPEMGLLAALGRMELQPDAGAVAALRSAVERIPAGHSFSGPLAERVAARIADDVMAGRREPRAGDDRGDRLDANARADEIIAGLESRCRDLRVYPALLPMAARWAAFVLSCTGAAQRRAGLHDDARWTTAVLSSFARKLERTDPGEAEFHLILSEAFVQVSKSGWEHEDYPAIEHALRQALAAAATAVSLAPRNADARMRLGGIQDKLVRVLSRRPTSR